MFFLHELERIITLHPSYFGPRVEEYLIKKLYEDVEGKFIESFYVVCVMDAYDISEGKVLPGSAVAEYTVHYRAVVWRPFKGEAVDGIVTGVAAQGFWADIGPMNIFVSRHHIPSDIKWDPDATPPQYTDNGDQVIERGTQLRIKVLGVRTDVTELFSVGSIKEDYLGQVLYDLRRFSQQAANSMHISFHHALLACRIDRKPSPSKSCEGKAVIPESSRSWLICTALKDTPTYVVASMTISRA